MKGRVSISPFSLDFLGRICYKISIDKIVVLASLLLLFTSPLHSHHKTTPDMLTITVSHNAVGAQRYFKEGLSKEGNYYLDQNIKSYYAGITSRLLGIEGRQVTEEGFARLSNRRHPDDDTIKLGVRDNDGARAGVDLTFSAPKCLSLLHAVTKDDELLAIHRRSYQAAMLEAEKLMYTQNNKSKKRGFTHTSNLAYAAFDHFLSRPMDEKIGDEVKPVAQPNLHSHCFIFNVTHNKERGRYEALEILNIHKNSDFLRTVYHNTLGLELEAAGYRVERDGNFIKLANVEREILERYSSRSQEINRIAAEKNLSAKQKGELGKLTRQAKSKISLSDHELRQHWLSKLTADELRTLRNLKGQPNKGLKTLSAKEAVDQALEHAFERNSVENIKKVIAYGAKLGYGQLSVTEITEELESRDNILKSEDQTIELITTRELVLEENRMIELATSGKGQYPALNKDYQIKQDFLNIQQQTAIREILSSQDQVVVLRGAPGVGKTSLLVEVKLGVESANKPLLAIAPSSQAALVLEEKGFQSNTVAGLLNSPYQEELLRKNVLLVDEAGMVAVRDMTALLELGCKYDTRVILSGDTRQNQPPAQYGDALSILEKQSRLLQVSTVNEIMRQRSIPHYKSAVQALWKGEMKRGYDLLDKQKSIVEIQDTNQRIEALAKDYVDTVANKKSALIVSPVHYEGNLINKAVRAELSKRNMLKGEEKNFDILKSLSLTNAQKKDLHNYQANRNQIIRFTKNQKGGFRAGSHHEILEVTKDKQIKIRDMKSGAVSHLPLTNDVEHFNLYEKDTIALRKADRIRLTNNSRSLQGTKMANGTTYEVKGFNKRGIELSNGKTIPSDLFHFRYSYTDTSFSSQGKDCHTALLSFSELSAGGINDKSFLVGVSRGTRDLRVYTSDKDFLKKSILKSADRLSANDIAKDHYQRQKQRQQRSYHKVLTSKMNRYEKTQRRQTAPERGFSEDRTRA